MTVCFGCAQATVMLRVQVREKALKEEPMGDREETYAAIRKTLALLNDPFTRFLVRSFPNQPLPLPHVAFVYSAYSQGSLCAWSLQKQSLRDVLAFVCGRCRSSHCAMDYSQH